MRERAVTALRGAAVAGLVAWVIAGAGEAERPEVAVLVGTGAALPLLAQPRIPVVCLVIAVVGLVGSDALAGRTTGDDPYIVMLLWASFGVGRWAGPRRQWVAGVVAVGLAVSAATVAGQTDLPADLVFPLLFTAAPWLLGRNRQVAEHRLRRLAEQAVELERGREVELRAAAQDERVRIARELHDVVAHSMSAVSLQAQVLRRRTASGQTIRADDLMQVEHAAQEAMRELRAMLGVLRPQLPDVVLAPAPGIEDLPALVARSCAAGQDVRLTETGDPVALHAGMSLTLHRLAQEAVTNARRHGAAGPTTVALTWDVDRVVLCVASPLAIVPAQSAPGHGLTGMRERTAAYQGRLEAGPDNGRWVVRAELPLAQL